MACRHSSSVLITRRTTSVSDSSDDDGQAVSWDNEPMVTGLSASCGGVELMVGIEPEVGSCDTPMAVQAGETGDDARDVKLSTALPRLRLALCDCATRARALDVPPFVALSTALPRFRLVDSDLCIGVVISRALFGVSLPKVIGVFAPNERGVLTPVASPGFLRFAWHCFW